MDGEGERMVVVKKKTRAALKYFFTSVTTLYVMHTAFLCGGARVRDFLSRATAFAAVIPSSMFYRKQPRQQLIFSVVSVFYCPGTPRRSHCHLYSAQSIPLTELRLKARSSARYVLLGCAFMGHSLEKAMQRAEIEVEFIGER